MNTDALQPAARRLGFEYVAGQIGPRQLVDPAFRVLPHGTGVVETALNPDHARPAGSGDEPHRLARDAESELDLRADTDPLDAGIERFQQGRVALVAAVEPDL